MDPLIRMTTENQFYSEFDTTCLDGERKTDYRSSFEIDRDRLIHTSAFRRLQAKTQVFLSGEYDFYRSRLTHSLEVAQIGRSITRYLNKTSPLLSPDFFIDEALVEASCLSHDLGHPPFGHAGERSLHNLMIPYGGFEGNAQTLRLLTETIYGDGAHRRGLNPSRAFIDGILKYKALFESYSTTPKNHFLYDNQKPILDFILPGQPIDPDPKSFNKLKSVECQIMDWADDTAYSANDIIDGAHAGFINLQKLELWEERQILDEEEKLLISELKELVKKGDLHRYFSKKIGFFIQSASLEEWNSPFQSLSNRWKFKVKIDGEAEKASSLYKKIAVDLVFVSPQLQQFEYKGNMMLERLFHSFMDQEVLGKGYKIAPPSLRARLADETTEAEKARVICDYLAGMTDRFATRTYKRLFDPDFGSIVDLV